MIIDTRLKGVVESSMHAFIEQLLVQEDMYCFIVMIKSILQEWPMSDLFLSHMMCMHLYNGDTSHVLISQMLIA